MTRKALDRMEAHRKFHAAESGQLQPRPRQRDTSTSGHKYSASDNMLLELETSRAVSWPITPGEILVDFKAPHKVETKTSPHVVPFKAFVEMHPPPKMTIKSPPSAWNDRTQGLLDEKLEAQRSTKKFVIRNNNIVSPPKSEPQTEQDAVESAALLGNQSRKVNSGFEIHPAGSLDITSTVIKDFGFSKEPLRESSNESKPRKLQKRNRSTSRERRQSIDIAS